MQVTIELESLPKNLRLEVIRLTHDVQVLTELAMVDDFDVVVAVASNPNTPSDVLGQLALDECEAVRIAVAKNPSTPADALDLLVNDSNWNVSSEVLSNPSMSKDTLLRLSSSKRLSGLMLHNPNLPDKVLQHAVSDIEQLGAYAAEGIIQNDRTPIEVLEQFSKSPSLSIRAAVAKCDRTPKGVLTTLSMDNEYSVRIAIAGNPNTPKGVLATMAHDADDNVCYALSNNPSTPARTLTNLVSSGRHYWPDVNEAVAIHPNTPKTTLNNMAKKYPTYVARNPNASSSTLSALFKGGSANVDVRRALAENPSCPIEIKDQLLHDGSYEVRLALTQNSHIGPHRLEELAKDSNPHVRYAAEQRLKLIRKY